MTHQTPYVMQADAAPAQPWKNGGGLTRELLAWPPKADWQMRVSRADIASDGPFSAFPGVQRWFVVLEGEGVILHFGDSQCRVQRGDVPLQFDGALAPDCFQIAGATQDLNLMVRGGAGMMQPVDSACAWQTTHSLCGLYCRVAGIWSDGRQNIALPAHSLLWAAESSGQTWRFSATPSADCSDAGVLNCAWWLGFTPAKDTIETAKASQ